MHPGCQEMQNGSRGEQDGGPRTPTAGASKVAAYPQTPCAAPTVISARFMAEHASQTAAELHAAQRSGTFDYLFFGRCRPRCTFHTDEVTESQIDGVITK
jgi:hypothetical protein